MPFELKCPNCGYPNLCLVVTKTTEMTYLLSTDGEWKSTPVEDAYGNPEIDDRPKILDSKVTLFCQFCGQENEAVLDSISRRYTIGKEMNHGHSVKIAEDGKSIEGED